MCEITRVFRRTGEVRIRRDATNATRRECACASGAGRRSWKPAWLSRPRATPGHIPVSLRALPQRLELRYSDRSATDIALDCGFSSSATFSRAFRAAFDTTPSRFRHKGEIGESKIRKEPFPELGYRLPMSAEEQRAAFPVRLVDLPERRIAYLRVVNAFEGGRVLAAFGAMVAWAKREGILEEGALFGMSIDDPHVTPRALYRYEVCFASSSPFAVAEGMSTLTLPPMRYAVARVSGDLRRVATAWDYLFRGWLIHSAYEPEHAPAIEVFLDKEAATDWSHFELDLCVPIRTLARTGG